MDLTGYAQNAIDKLWLSFDALLREVLSNQVYVAGQAAGDWFPADMNLLQQYLEVIASTAPSSDAPAADSLSDDMIWEYVHEKLDYAHWAQDMTAEYEDIVRKFQIEDSKMSDLPGDVSPGTRNTVRLMRSAMRWHPAPKIRRERPCM